MTRRIFALFLFFAVNVTALSAQNEDVVNQWNSWFMYFGNHRLTDKWSLHTEYQWRRSDVVRYWQQSLARIGMDYRTGDNAMVTAGYAYIITFPYGKQPVDLAADEHRIWQQLILTQRSGRFHLQHRYRLEQRWIEKVVDDGDGNPVMDGRTYKNRTRYRLFAAIPFNQRTMGEGAWFIGLYDEVFLGFGKNVGKKNILDQNRFYAALGYQFSPRGNLQLGYLNHQVFKSDGLRRENDHTLQIALTYNMDWRKN